MGKKVHPTAFRLGILTTWSSRWFADRRSYRTYLEQDVGIRTMIKSRFREAGIADVVIERNAKNIAVTVHASRPGVVIGRGGQGAEKLKQDIRTKYFVGADSSVLQLNIVEVERAALSAPVVVQQVIQEIEQRMPFRRVLRQALGRVERAGALGARIQVSGRLNGAEIARRESVRVGSVPLQTLRADISYAQDFAKTIYGSIGVKVWIYRGEVFEEKRGEHRRAPLARK
ncbi:MAG: 30S ribosomal protein S3 [bacterium]|nr:30S ribosomal protein S3 [bacterium]